jgi:ABC-2 type transport system ATP-binding protein
MSLHRAARAKNGSCRPKIESAHCRSGQMQKLVILLSLGHEPDLLVLDEPVASLDPAARRQFLATLLEIALTGHRTVLLSTHITSDLERVADQVAVIKDGKVVYDDELSTLKDTVKRLRISSQHPACRQICGNLPGVAEQSVQTARQRSVISVRGFEDSLPSSGWLRNGKPISRWKT